MVTSSVQYPSDGVRGSPECNHFFLVRLCDDERYRSCAMSAQKMLLRGHVIGELSVQTNSVFSGSKFNWEIIMLVLSRKLGEKIVIGDNIVVTVVKIDRNQIRIGIEAPGDVPVYREEIAPQRMVAKSRSVRGGSGLAG